MIPLNILLSNILKLGVLMMLLTLMVRRSFGWSNRNSRRYSPSSSYMNVKLKQQQQQQQQRQQQQDQRNPFQKRLGTTTSSSSSSLSVFNKKSLDVSTSSSSSIICQKIQNCDGTVTARIVPKENLDYARKTKPFQRRATDESVWKRVVFQGDGNINNNFNNNNNNTFQCFTLEKEIMDQQQQQPTIINENDSDEDDHVVILDIDFTTTTTILESNNNNKNSNTNTNHSVAVPVPIELHMHRQANEPANRTLRRMEISTQRKMMSGFRYGSRKVPKKRESSGSGATTTEDATTTTTSRIMIKTPSGSCKTTSFTASRNNDDDDDDEALDSDGYIQYEINNPSVRIDQLLTELRQYSEIILYMDGLTNNGDGDDSDSQGIALRFNPLPPTILSVQTFEDFCAHVFVGVPLVVESQVLHAERPVIIWFSDTEQVAFDSNIYTPTMNDIGKTINVLIVPLFCCHKGEKYMIMEDYAEVYQYEKKVQQRPYLPIVDRRIEWLHRPKQSSDTTSNLLRVMSYNLLADIYTTREIDQQAMYNHCKPEDIARTRRMPLLVYEILAHQPDILCLQEVDESIYKQLLFPVLKAHGYHGYYSTKVSAQLEGCAMFWNLKVFHQEALLEQFPIRDLVEMNSENDNQWESMKDIKNLLDRKPDLKRVVKEKIGQVFQVATLRLKHPEGKSKSLVVGNTHLFYHPMADHIRAIQTYMICMQIDRMRKTFECSKSVSSSTSVSSSPSPFIICGDLNSDPLSGAVRLLMNRELESNHFETWKHLDAYTWEHGEEEFLLEHGFIGNSVGDVPIYEEEAFCNAIQDDTNAQQPSPLFSSSSPPTDIFQLSVQPPTIRLPCSFPELEIGYDEIPEFTNYAVDFTETLDYIFASKISQSERVGFELVSSASIPRKSEMEASFVAMPNPHMPSDHVSIACDFKWVTH